MSRKLRWLHSKNEDKKWIYFWGYLLMNASSMYLNMLCIFLTFFSSGLRYEEHLCIFIRIYLFIWIQAKKDSLSSLSLVFYAIMSFLRVKMADRLCFTFLRLRKSHFTLIHKK